jgi:hypothetical protein
MASGKPTEALRASATRSAASEYSAGTTAKDRRIRGGIRHIVLMRFPDDCPAETIDSISEQLNQIRSTLPGMIDLHAGPDVTPGLQTSRFTHGLTIDFADQAARDTYFEFAIRDRPADQPRGAPRRELHARPARAHFPAGPNNPTLPRPSALAAVVPRRTVPAARRDNRRDMATHSNYLYRPSL